MKNLKNKFKRGFTLIEVLLVITMISVVASIFIGSNLNTKSQSRDIQRSANLRAVEKALIAFDVENDGVPISFYTTFSSLPRLADGKLDCATMQTNMNNFYDALVPRYLSQKVVNDIYLDKGYCYTYMTTAIVAGQSFDNSYAENAVFFIPYENMFTVSGNQAAVGVSVGNKLPIRLNYNITTGEKHDLDDLSIDYTINSNTNPGYCPQNSTWNSVTRICDCNNGYIRNGDICRIPIVCPIGEENVNDLCYAECGSHMIRDFYTPSVCNCVSGYFWNELLQFCQFSDCPAGQYRNEQNYCQNYPECFNGKVFNTENWQCQCPGDQVENYEGNCVCPTGKVWNENTNICEIETTCYPPYVNSPNNTCVCPAGTIDSGSDCVSTSCQEGSGKIFSTQYFTCVCPEGTIENPNTNICVSTTCEEPKYFSNTTYSCVCPENTVLDENTGACNCASGYYKPTGQSTCVEFPICYNGMIFKPAIEACECPEGMFLNQDGYCEAIQP